ncbi:hypothetical protein [Acinetobacter bohemicus]|uniref:hypothetical protein n=1 Tax=Acinetobacter bohemicus TaxID=1435036 RepID=UPI0040424BA5
MNTTKILGEAVGIQRQDIIDRTEEQTADGLTGAVILGRFKRGRFNVPMEIHQGNIRGQLGYDPKNPDYIAVQDCLDTNVPSVQVLRLKSNISGSISLGISPDLQYRTGAEDKPIHWNIEVNSILYPANIGRVSDEDGMLYIEDYLEANKNELGVIAKYEEDDITEESVSHIYNITNERKFVRLIPSIPYISSMKLIGNPTAKIDSDGIISFWLEANNEVPEPEPETTYHLTIDDKGLLPEENIYSGTIEPPLIGAVLSFNIQQFFPNGSNGRVFNIYSDPQGLIVSPDGATWKVDGATVASSWDFPTASDFITPATYSLSINKMYGDEVIVGANLEYIVEAEPCTPTVIPINNNLMGVDNLVFKYSINGGEVKSHTQNTDSSAKIHTVLVNILFYSNAILSSYGMGNFYSSVAKNYFINYDYPIQGAPSGNGEPMTVEFWATPDVDNCLVTKAFGGDFVLHSCGKIVWTEDKIKYPNVL